MHAFLVVQFVSIQLCGLSLDLTIKKIPDLPSNMQFQSPFLSLPLEKGGGGESEENFGGREGRVRGPAKTWIAGKMHLRIAVFAGQRFNNYKTGLHVMSEYCRELPIKSI